MENRAAESFVAVAEDGAKLRAWSYGAGSETLLLVSGLGGTGGFWKEAAPLLAAGRRVICFDQRGIGASDRGQAQVTIDLLARDCLAVLDAAETERCLLLGHSTGGCIGQTFAATQSKRVSGLILSATWLKPSRYMTALFESRREILDDSPLTYAATSVLFSYMPAWLEDNWQIFDTAVANAPATREAALVVRERIDALLAFDGSALAPSLDLPALVLGARDDMIVPLFQQQILASALPVVDMTVFEAGGHFFPVSQRAEFVAEVTKWIASR